MLARGGNLRDCNAAAVCFKLSVVFCMIDGENCDFAATATTLSTAANMRLKFNKLKGNCSFVSADDASHLLGKRLKNMMWHFLLFLLTSGNAANLFRRGTLAMQLSINHS